MSRLGGENLRQTIHLLVGAFGLLFHWLSWQQAALLAGLAGVNNFVILPLLKIDRSFLRKEERYLSGVKLYPLVVLALVLVFRDRLPLAAGCWAVLAVGDSVSNFFGRRYGRAKLPWNRDKSWVGTTAFALFSFPAAGLTLWWAQAGTAHEAITISTVAALAMAGSVAGAVAESLPFRIDDNITVGLAAGVAMAWAGGCA